MQSIPRRIEPRKFAHQGVSLVGYVPTQDLPRLTEMASLKEVNATLSFSLGERREKLLLGQIQVAAQMQCQRCLKQVDVDVQCDVSLAVVWDEEKATELAKCYEPWIVSEEEADLYLILEEEILLNMPLVVAHKENCIDSSLLAQGPAVEKTETTDETNPFQVLMQLKDKTKKPL